MSDSEIDEAVLAVVQTSWRKVAMIISKAADRLGSSLPEGDDGHALIAKRIKALVNDGRLVAQGNLENWRFSEVKIP